MARWQTFLGFDTPIQAQLTIHPVNTFVIPLKPLRSQPVHHLVKAPASVSLGQGRELLPNGAVIWSPRLIAIRAPAQSDQAAGAPLAGGVLLHRIGRQFTSLGQALQLFFDNVFEDLVIQTQLGIHAFQPPVFFFQLFHAPQG